MHDASSNRGVIIGAVALMLCLADAQTSVKGILTPQATPPSTEQAVLPAPTPAPTPVQSIPLPEIANQAEDLDRLLREVSKTLLSVLEVRVSDPEGRAHAEEVAHRARQAEDLLSGMPNMMQLQDEDRYWRSLAEQYGSQRKLLTEHAASIEKAMRSLDAEQARWQATFEQVVATSGLTELATRVQRELDGIQKVRSEAQEQLNLILTLQNRISEQDREISGVMLKLDEARERLRGRLLERDSYPLWAARELRISDQSISTVIYISTGRGFTGASGFVRAKKSQFFATAAIYFFALLAAFYFKRHTRVPDADEPAGNVDAQRIFARPFSVALLITSLATFGFISSAPTGVSFIVCLFYLIPILRLLPALITPGMRNILYVICTFYVLEWIHLVLQFEAVFKREMFAVIIFIALVLLAWFARPSRLKMEAAPGWRSNFLIGSIRLGLLLLALSFCANILGFVSLAQILGVGTLFSGFTFALLYTMVRVFELSLTLVLHSNWFRSLPDARGEVVARWGRRILVCCASLLWLNINLYLFTVRDSVVSSIRETLEHPIGFGKVHITLAGTLSLFFFLLLGYAIANIAKFIMEEVFLPRLSLRGGLGYAISRVTYYALLVGIFFAAVTDSGVELNKFTVITGALGLGVGFGLQNIVSNFASGLIILFERPFRIGDTVEVAGVVGTVRRIGARSSTILTYQYAEVIFPNSNLLSNQVINWTLTSARRRVEVPVGIAYGTNPELALKLLIEVADSNPRIMKDPKPEAFFLGFGDSALNLELRFWAAQSIWFELKSDIGLAIVRSFRKAGIEIPYPQRDLHVRTLDFPAKKEISGVSDGEEPKKMSAGR